MAQDWYHSALSLGLADAVRRCPPSLSQELTGPSGNCHPRPPYTFICASESGFLLWQKTQWGAMILLLDSAVSLLLPKNTKIRC